MPLRLLVRATPFVLGAVALAIWLRRRQAQRRVLPPTVEPAPPPPPPPPPPRQSTRFVRASEQRPVDIVTVVDDLLGVPS